MKKLVPDYYNDFRCLAGSCRHNCCIGWEIDIDEETLAFYENVPGEMGRRLKENICYDGGTAHYCMKPDGRCPFLNENDLCDIVINLGFDKTSQICDDHPRFRNFYSGREETGLGMSCEAVAKLILSKTEKVQLVCVEEDEEELWPDEWDFIDTRDEIFDILQDRTLSVDKRIAETLSLCRIEPAEYTVAQLADIFMPLERLDENWTVLLENLKETEKENISCDDSSFDIPFEQLLVYLVFRHMTESLDDDRFKGRLLMVINSFYLIRYLLWHHKNVKGNATIDDLEEISRMFSAEIEYSTENTDALAEYFENI